MDGEKKQQRVYKICITGGPCAGKTTSLNILKEKFTPRFQVYVLPELAATTFGAGVTIIPSEFTPENHVVFTGGIMNMQLKMEDYFGAIASIQKQDVIILCDRGVMDNTAYCSKETEAKVYEQFGWTKTDIRDNRYDMVVHLVSAADGAEKFYTLANNEARSETPEVARVLDRKTQNVWNGHPNHVIIDNNVANFEEKIDRAYKNICKVLEIQEIPTYNKKFLLEAPVALADIPEDLLAEQFSEKITFLNTNEADHITWIKSRKAENGAMNLGYIDRTITENESERLEIRRSVHPTLYGEYMKMRDPARNDVEKNIIQFVFSNLSFNVETYQDRNGETVNMLRVFVDNADTKIEFPEFLKVGADITLEPKYFSHNLADPNFA